MSRNSHFNPSRSNRSRFHRGAAALVTAGFLLLAGLVSEGAASPAPVAQAAEDAVQAGVDAELLQILLERASLPAGDGVPVLPQEILIEWIETAARLAEEDLPSDPILSRYLQGLAKGVPAARIETAVRELEGRLREAAALVDATCPSPGYPDPKERLVTIDHTAYALGVDIPTGHVRHSLELAASEPDPVLAAQAPVLTLGMLAASGLEGDMSFQVVEAAWSRGYRGESLGRLGATLGGANPGGAPPPELVKEVLELLDHAASEDRFFEGLDELMGRQGYRLPAVGIENDPMGRRGDRTRARTPVDTPRDPGIPQPVIGD